MIAKWRKNDNLLTSARNPSIYFFLNFSRDISYTGIRCRMRMSTPYSDKNYDMQNAQIISVAPAQPSLWRVSEFQRQNEKGSVVPKHIVFIFSPKI